uniref:Putative secreted protein n=1 Tax=Ixodes ricinus TaxID=34613 RepID=A0A6B0U6K5_IXORI
MKCALTVGLAARLSCTFCRLGHCAHDLRPFDLEFPQKTVGFQRRFNFFVRLTWKWTRRRRKLVAAQAPSWLFRNLITFGANR